MLSEPDQERFMRLWTSAQPAVANYVHALVRDHSAAKDVAAQAAHADNASVVAEWFVHVMSFRFVLMPPSYHRQQHPQQIMLRPYHI